MSCCIFCSKPVSGLLRLEIFRDPVLLGNVEFFSFFCHELGINNGETSLISLSIIPNCGDCYLLYFQLYQVYLELKALKSRAKWLAGELRDRVVRSVKAEEEKGTPTPTGFGLLRDQNEQFRQDVLQSYSEGETSTGTGVGLPAVIDSGYGSGSGWEEWEAATARSVGSPREPEMNRLMRKQGNPLGLGLKDYTEKFQTSHATVTLPSPTPSMSRTVAESYSYSAAAAETDTIGQLPGPCLNANSSERTRDGDFILSTISAPQTSCNSEEPSTSNAQTVGASSGGLVDEEEIDIKYEEYYNAEDDEEDGISSDSFAVDPLCDEIDLADSESDAVVQKVSEFSVESLNSNSDGLEVETVDMDVDTPFNSTDLDYIPVASKSSETFSNVPRTIPHSRVLRSSVKKTSVPTPEVIPTHPFQTTRSGSSKKSLRIVKLKIMINHSLNSVEQLEVCPICQIPLTNNIYCRLFHLVTKHEIPAAENNKKFCCSECGQKFYVEILLNRHRELHSERESTLFPCDYCYTGFYSLEILKFHRSCHTPPLSDSEANEFQKKIDENGIKKSELNQPQRPMSPKPCKKMKEADTDTRCEFCSVPFTHSGMLLDHCKAYHPKRFKYVCSTCGEKYKTEIF